jgi:hypothetical protein
MAGRGRLGARDACSSAWLLNAYFMCPSDTSDELIARLTQSSIVMLAAGDAQN